jgi:hypothetical protein
MKSRSWLGKPRGKTGRGATERRVAMTPDALQGIRWKGEATYRVLSYYFGMRWNSGPSGDYVRSFLEPFAVPPDPQEQRNPPTPGTPPIYFVVDRGRNRNGDRHELLYGDQNTASTMIRTGDYLLVHAGAVVTPGGDALLLPAPSGSGKTTLVAGLVRGGFAYLSDEAAAIDPVTGTVHPYPKPLSMKIPPEELFPDLVETNGRRELVPNLWLLRAEDLRPHALGRPADIRFVVAPRYRAGASTDLVPISRASGLVELGHNALNLALYRSRAITLLARVISRTRCYRLDYGDLDEAIRAIERLSRPPRPRRGA